MKELAIKRELNEETRRESVWCQMGGTIECFSLHITEKKEVILTDHTAVYPELRKGLGRLYEGGCQVPGGFPQRRQSHGDLSA